MRGKTALLATLLALAVLLAAAGGTALILHDNYLIDFQLYPKNAVSMDLRGQDISIDHYEALRQKLPRCEILWDVPFQGGKVSWDVTDLTVDILDQVQALDIEEYQEYLKEF